MLDGMLQAAHASLDAGRYSEAIAAYTAILKRNPENVDAITHLGVILALAGHLPEALEAFDRALAIDPNYAHALWDKAGVQEARQDHAGAVQTLERFVRVAPPGPDRDRAEQRLRDARAKLAAAPKTGAPAKQP
jgi:tetratricopeptide (TPR) repeat protein